MKTRVFIAALFGIFIAGVAGFADTRRPAEPPLKQRRLLDLGDLEIKGEIRKPLVRYFESDQASRAIVPQLAREQLLDFEATLTSPSRPEVPSHGKH